MRNRIRRVMISALSVAVMGATAVAPAQDTMKFQVEGGNPGGEGSYKGEVELTKLSSATAKARWITGANKEVVEGIAIKTDNAIGAAYGGKALYALALYTIKGKTIEAVWTTAAAPKESGTYALKGADFQGALSFVDGTPGTVTFTAAGENVYKVVWQLASGRFEGVGVRKGNVLAAASGEKGGAFGVAGYVPKGDVIDGVWAMNGATAAGTEVWSLGGAPGATTAKAPVGDGTKVTFDGETYTLKDKKSAPGQPTAELREYLRDGETFEDYRKMIGLRTHVTPVDAATMAKAVLAQVQKEHPNSYVKEIAMDPDAATIFFILVVGNDAELNLWCYQKAAGGLSSAQFVLRNKPPYETQKKFKAEQDKNFDQWLKEIGSLAGQAQELVVASATATPAPPAAPAPASTSSDEISPDLVKAIKADMDKCGKIAQEFMTHLKGGDTDKAVTLMNDAAFAGTSRDAFLVQLNKSNGVFGQLKSFKPDRKATTFEMKDGLVNFYLHADAEYTNASVHEVLRFVRNKNGEIEFVGYNRTAK